MPSYRLIVVGTDGSDTSLRAVDKAAALAAESGAKLVVASAHTPQRDAAGPDPDQPRHQRDTPVSDLLADAADRAKSAGAHDVDVRAMEGAPADALVDLAEELGADLLVVGSVGQNSVVGRLVGSVPRLVKRRAKTEVLVVETSG